MAKNRVYKLIYIDDNPESVAKLQRIIRTYGLSSDFVIDVVEAKGVDELHRALEQDQFDLVLVKNAPHLPQVELLVEIIDITTTALFVVVESGELEEALPLIDLGAEEIVTLSSPTTLYKKIITALNSKNVAESYRQLREKHNILQKQAETFLNQSEEGIAYTIDGLFTDFNEAFWRRLGYQSEDEFLGVLLLDLIDPNFLEQFRAAVSEAMRGDSRVEIEGSFINGSTGVAEKLPLSLSKTLYEGETVLEIRILTDQKGSGTLEKSGGEVNKLAFIRQLKEVVGPGIWLLNIKLDDYISIWSKEGTLHYEEYFAAVQELIQKQFQGVEMHRYTDDSLLLVVEGVDVMSIDRIGATIANSVSNYQHTFVDNGVTVQSEASSAYISLNIEAKDLSNTLMTLEEQAKLIPVITSLGKERQTEELPRVEDEDNSTGEALVLEPLGDEHGEFSVLGDALEEQRLRYTYLPIADFIEGSKGYLADYEVLDANGTVISWNKAFMHTANNPVAQRLDAYLISQAIKELRNYKDVQKVMLHLTASILLNQDFADTVFKTIQSGRAADRIVLMINKDVVFEHKESAVILFNRANSEGLAIGVYGIATESDEDQLQELLQSTKYIALQPNLISRLSRTRDQTTKNRVSEFFTRMSDQKVTILAEGVNNATSMASVWEYNIPLAVGSMIGSPSETMDFDFSQLII